MVGKKPSTSGCPSRKTPGEPALAQRLRRNISPKNLDSTAGLSWREERELNKALYASLQETKKLTIKSELDLDPALVPSNSIPRRNLLARVLPRRQSPRSSKPVAHGKSNMSMRSPTLPPPSDKRLKSQHSIGGDESSQDSMRSSTTSCSTDDLKGRLKVRAQRKFAQMHAYGNTMVPSQHTPVKHSSKTSSPIKVFPKRAKTEDFLTFLCLRGTQALPPHLDFFNFSRDEGDTSLPPTPPNRGRVFLRESSPSSSSTSCSNVPDEVADSPAPLVMPPSGRVTPSRKAARACAGTPETARGLASFPSRQGQRSQATSKRRQGCRSPAITPAKSTRSYRNGTPSPIKGSRGKASPGKMTDAERLCIKRKAIATLTSSKLSPDKKSRRKSLFVDQSEMDEKPGRQRQTKVTSVLDTSSVVTGTNSCGQEARDGDGVSRSCNVVDVNLSELSGPSIADVVYACTTTSIAKSTPACCTTSSATACLDDDDDSKSSKLYSSGMILPAGLMSSYTQTPSVSTHTHSVSSEDVILCSTQVPLVSIEEATSSPPETCLVSIEDISSPPETSLVSIGEAIPSPSETPLVSNEEAIPCLPETPLVSNEEAIPCLPETPLVSIKEAIPCLPETPLVSIEENIPCATKTLSVSAGVAVPSPTTQTNSTQDVIYCPTQSQPVSPKDIIPCLSQTYPVSAEDFIPYPIQTHPVISEDVIPYPTKANSASAEDFFSCPIQTNHVTIEDSIPSPTQTHPMSSEDIIPYPTQTHPLSTEDVIPCPTQAQLLSSEDVNPCPFQSHPLSTEDVHPRPTQTHPLSTENVIPYPTQIHPLSTENVIPYPTQTHPLSTEDVIPYPTQTNPLSTEDVIPYPTQTHPLSSEDVIPHPTQIHPLSSEDVNPCPFQSHPLSTEDVIPHPTQPYPLSTKDAIPCLTPQTPSVSSEEMVSYSSKMLESGDALPRPFPAYVPPSSKFGPLIKGRFNTESVKSECQSRYLDIEVMKITEHDTSHSCQSQLVFDSTPNNQASETIVKIESENPMHLNLSPCLKVSSDNIFHSEMTFENTDKFTQTEKDVLPSFSDTALTGLGNDSPPVDKIKKVVTLPEPIVKMTTPVSVGCVINIDDSGFIDSCLDSPVLSSPFPKSLPKHKGILAKYKNKTSTPYSKSKTRKETFVSFLLPPKVQSHVQTAPKSLVKASSTSKIMRIDPPTSSVIAPPACHIIASPTSDFTTSPISEPPLSGKSVVHARVDNCPIRASASILPHHAPPYSVLTSIRKQKLAMKSLDAVSVLSSANETQPGDGLRPSVRTLFPPPPTLCYREIPE